MRASLAAASDTTFSVLHFSVQNDHVHLLVEAKDKHALSRGMRGLAIRTALAVNGALGRHGSLWADRYHCRPLKTPREVRAGIVYILTNWRKHLRSACGVDPCSSARWFDGWRGESKPLDPDLEGEPSPVALGRTWLARLGWRKLGLIGPEEGPKRAR